MKKKLVLRRESLTDLSPADLRRVAGADGTHRTCYTDLTWCKLCDLINWPTREGCTPTPDA